MKGLQECILLHSPPPRSEVGWWGRRRGNRTSAEPREVRRAGGGRLCPARCQRKTEEPQGRRKGEVAPGLWTQWPARMGTGRGGVERGGIESREDDVENFIGGKQARSQGAGGIIAPPCLTSSPSPVSIIVQELPLVWGPCGSPPYSRLADLFHPLLIRLPEGSSCPVTTETGASPLPYMESPSPENCSDDPSHRGGEQSPGGEQAKCKAKRGCWLCVPQ